MPTAHARVSTDRAGRYLTQLASHVGRMATHGDRLRNHGHHGAPPAAPPTGVTGTDAVLTFDGGRCTLHATDSTLILHTEADDEQRLQEITSRVAARLERIGERDGLTVAWHPGASDVGH
jgi:hypothetical protein